MRGALWIALLLLPAGLTGCVGSDETSEVGSASTDIVDLGELSDKVYDVLPVEEVRVASSVDGKTMHNAVYRPDTDEPVPVFINFSPYWGDTAERRGDGFAEYMIDEYVPRGYAVVLSAVRGTGHSEGCFQIGGDLELQDAYDVVDHFANADWSNGNVAAGGKSYDSTTQNGVIAKFPHPALKGIFHVSGITDMYRYNYRAGVPYGHGTAFNTYYYLQGTDEYGLSFLSSPSQDNLMSETPESIARVIDDAACTELPEMQASGIGSGVHGAKTDYWVERDWTRYIGDSDWTGSIFFVHGLQDWNVKPDHILPWLDELPPQVDVLGWLHQDTENNGHVYPMRADWNRTMLRWLDHTLKGVDTGLLDEPAFQVQGTDGTWRTSETWPPADALGTTFAVEVEGPAVDPTDMLDGPSGWTGTVIEAGDEPVRYAGVPTLNVTFSSDHADPVLTAVLYDQGPDGELTWTNEGVLRAVYRAGLEDPQPVMPGEPYEVTIEMYPQDDVLEPGHSWVLVLGGDPQQAQPTAVQLAGVTYDAGTVALTLPTAPLDGEVEPQPEPTPCFAC